MRPSFGSALALSSLAQVNGVSAGKAGARAAAEEAESAANNAASSVAAAAAGDIDASERWARLSQASVSFSTFFCGIDNAVPFLLACRQFNRVRSTSASLVLLDVTHTTLKLT